MKDKLPKAFKKKWIAALRSGRYLQTKHILRNSHGYCCLGVAGSICGYSDIKLARYGVLDKNKFPKVPKQIQGDADTNPIVTKLTEFNDNGRSFNWIASYIERYL